MPIKQLDPTQEYTVRDTYCWAIENLTEPVDALAFLTEIANYIVQREAVTYEDAQALARQNLGYVAGYYDVATMQRVRILFNAIHPIFSLSQEKTDDPA